MDREQARKVLFLCELAKFLGENQGAKSILLQMESQRPVEDQRPRLATHWAQLLQFLNLRGYASVSEIEARLQSWFLEKGQVRVD